MKRKMRMIPRIKKIKKKEGIKYEINGYLERDEFALNLNKNIKGFFEQVKDRLTKY